MNGVATMLSDQMLMLGTRILLAVLLTVSSPAWCACALASTRPSEDASAHIDADDESCCPGAQQREGDGDRSSGHNDQGLPCRDQSDCPCCDSLPGLTTPVAKNPGLLKALLKADLAPMQAVVAASVASVPDLTTGVLQRRGAPPPLTAAAPLLLRGCLLLT